jgi:hypothetical protein
MEKKADRTRSKELVSTRPFYVRCRRLLCPHQCSQCHRLHYSSPGLAERRTGCILASTLVFATACFLPSLSSSLSPTPASTVTKTTSDCSRSALVPHWLLLYLGSVLPQLGSLTSSHPGRSCRCSLTRCTLPHRRGCAHCGHRMTQRQRSKYTCDVCQVHLYVLCTSSLASDCITLQYTVTQFSSSYQSNHPSESE